MLLVSLFGFCHQHQMTSSSMCGPTLRCGDDKPKKMANFATPAALLLQNKRKSSCSATIATLKTHHFSPPKSYHEVLVAAREKFTQEISFRSKDKDISLAKTLLYISAEDEAFMAFNREMDAHSLKNERKDTNRLHWKRASRTNHGLMLTSPLRPIHDDNEKWSKTDSSSMPLLRPQDLRLAIMASEKLLILQPHNWALRRDHGMMLYYSRDYAQAVQELSICMAFAPEEEAEVLEPFVEKLHLLRLESSWKSRGHKGRLTVL
ncbi:hypothetical protein Ccrd_002798 [Cynara cardunculus var. scolymus]|uniref:Uncharacterized protein n=1 Tax=Cynara cardunculus var. scolymus TaxID=59895 RepID=A0A103XQR8_CYNCS|nr:hypothetical protein Ccrd_002798 [Cynara cardunculus var. scolymus]